MQTTQIFSCKTKNQYKTYFIFLKKLQKATGSTINHEKTTVLPINTDQISKLPKQIQIKQRYETTKILGTQFNEDLQLANSLNWTKIIEKINHQINKLSQRILSLKGKVQIINTLILSKTSFLSNTFPIDLQTTLIIEQKIFKYLWNNKQEQIARKPSFFQKNLEASTFLKLKHII